MLKTYPPYSDLSNDKSQNGSEWANMLANVDECSYYSSGLVFEERIEDENVDGEKPLKYPAAINLVKMLALAQADAMYGDWNDMPFKFGVIANQESTPDDEEAINLMNTIMAENDAGSLFWELEYDRNIYGGAAFKVGPMLDPYSAGNIKITRVSRSNFFPIWNPSDDNDLLFTMVATQVTLEQAQLMYPQISFDKTKDAVDKIERWTKSECSDTIDEKELMLYGKNPYGIIPFVYVPRFRSTTWWGDDLTHEVINVQNELNSVVGDMGDAINYGSHPIRWARNLSKDFNSKNFPVGANSMWNLGRTISGSYEPEIGILEASHAITPEAFDYVKFIYDWSRTSVFAPPIAFGEDQGGGQRSGVTLEIRMWPLIKYIRRSRAYMTTALSRSMKIIASILANKQFTTKRNPSQGALASLMSGRITPIYEDVLPADHAKIVDEVVKLLSTNPPSISLETAQDILGRGPGEVGRIKEMQQDKDLLQNVIEEERAEAQEEKFDKEADDAKSSIPDR